MELKKALVHTGICKTEDLGLLRISLQISDGLRNDNARSQRYFISLNGKVICSVKQLPVNGIFSLDNIILTQKLFSKLSGFTAPSILGTYHGDDANVYIIEEPILSAITLHDAITRSEVPYSEAVRIMGQIFQEVAAQPSSDIDPQLLAKEVAEFITTAEMLSISNKLTDRLRDALNQNMEWLAGRVIYTTRDLIPKNILLSKGKPVIVDYDLSRRTHFFWLDIYRANHYSTIPLEKAYLHYTPECIDPLLLKLLFLLSEVHLQGRVLNKVGLTKAIASLQADTLMLIDQLFANDCVRIPVIENPAKSLPSVDGSSIEGISESELQIFWAKENLFNEENSIRVPLLFDGVFHKYEIPLPLDVAGYLRLDPGNQPAYVEIKSIKLYTADEGTPEGGKLSACWSADNSFAGLLPGSGVVRLDGAELLRLICVNSDPQIFLGEITERNDEQPWVLQMVMRIDKNIKEVISSEINRAKEELEEKEELLNRRTDELLEKNQQLSRHTEEISRMRAVLAEKDEQLSRIFNSSSWRLTAPLRGLGKFSRRIKEVVSSFIEIIIRRQYRPVLVPVADLQPLSEEGPGIWETIDSDPQFLLKGPWPKGWAEVSWLASAERPLKMRLYIDRGSGFNELDSVELGLVNSDAITRYHALIYLRKDLRGLRLDPGELPGRFILSEFKMVRISRLEVFSRAVWFYLQRQGLSLMIFPLLFKKAWGIIRREGIHGLWRRAKQHISLSHPGSAANIADYELWVKHHILSQDDKERICSHIQKFAYRPLFSVIVPVYNVEERWLRKCIESVLGQLYPYWELCIADDASTKPHVRQVLEEYAAKDTRIKVIYREKNGHISAASNSALELATGEFIALLDHDDELSPDALYENAVLLNHHPEADMIYSDEDKISEEGKRHSPFFKPDWSPDTFLSQMYTCHLGVYRTELVRRVGGFRKGLEGSQDYDLVLRLTEKTGNIFHIPKVLYHWRTIAESTASSADTKGYAHLAGLKAIEEALERRGENGWVESADNYPNMYRVHYILKDNPLISILIPTRDMAQLLAPCLESIFTKSTYSNYEVIVIDNGSNEQETFEIFTKWKGEEPKRFRVERLDIPFNYSKLNNEGVRLAKGELILLLNNDVEVITSNWLEEMAGQAMRSSIGAVGAKLLYPDHSIQHAGVVLGIGGVAGHSHKGFSKSDLGYFGTLLRINNVSAVTGACLMVKKQLFEAVGGLNERLKVAFNDVDFCLKLLQKGVYNVVLPHVQLYHYESKSRGYEDTPEKQSRFLGEVARMQERWGYLLANDPFYNPNLTREREDFSLGIPKD